MNPLKIALISLSITTIAACSKKEDPVPSAPPKSKAQMLASHRWKYDVLVHNYHTISPVTVYKRGQAGNTYNLDSDNYSYNIDGTYSATLTADPFSVSGRWNLIPDETQIEVRTAGGGATYTATIIQLDDNNYIFTYADQDSYGKLIPY